MTMGRKSSRGHLAFASDGIAVLKTARTKDVDGKEKRQSQVHRMIQDLLPKKAPPGCFALVPSRLEFAAPATEEPKIATGTMKRTLKIPAVTPAKNAGVEGLRMTKRIKHSPQKLVMYYAG